MGKFVKGEVVVIPFPFSDLSGSKRRPALVLADLTGDDILLCQITSKAVKGQPSVALTTRDFAVGSLPVDSFVRPLRIFTADKTIIIRSAGILKSGIANEVVRKIVDVLNA
ncbi:type II toxin-antitoxin system PemK/MazF family toxin [Dyadobacter sp. CY343]|uniref:type II toxin-antitoxin system PemK/MazF family toxin n=1 Tax=Dyadobacter sp. CY343 TaxID=2907299 RepID=UPI001F2E9DA3|nr:type II toxin-antitoxin system PemK/MazF family toxin [Dyadobacter sp. CY343]MCE7058687.1 type II toxin-antitoxin system PemK/MazF family toxin [Dyadobacter sp. CY343]